jgi:uncharacterized protein with von Willebrand factor type A (vWA) domain
MKMHEQHLEEFEAYLQRIEDALYEKLDRDDFEYQLREMVDELSSKLEEIHDDVREVHGVVEDVEFKLEYPPDRKG